MRTTSQDEIKRLINEIAKDEEEIRKAGNTTSIKVSRIEDSVKRKIDLLHLLSTINFKLSL